MSKLYPGLATSRRLRNRAHQKQQGEKISFSDRVKGMSIYFSPDMTAVIIGGTLVLLLCLT